MNPSSGPSETLFIARSGCLPWHSLFAMIYSDRITSCTQIYIQSCNSAYSGHTQLMSTSECAIASWLPCPSKVFI